MAVDEGTIRRAVLTELARHGIRYVPVGISVRHVHLSAEDLGTLFGAGYELHPLRNLSQPGQYAAKEQVTLEGPKGILSKVRIIGPLRKATQVELSVTDAMAIGIRDIPVRMSGDLTETSPIRIVGPQGSIEIPEGTIAAARHIHMSDVQARAYGVHDGQVLSLRMEGERPCLLGNVVVRTGSGHELEFHVDTDEANACLLKNGDLLELVFPGDEHRAPEACADGKIDPSRIAQAAAQAIGGTADALQGENFRVETGVWTPEADHIFDLVTEPDVNRMAEQGQRTIYCEPKAIITPAAADRAAQLGVTIERTKKAGIASGQGIRSCSAKAAGSDGGQRHIPEAEEDILELVTADDLNSAFRDDKRVIYCTHKAIITPAARERIAETGIRVIRISERS